MSLSRRVTKFGGSLGVIIPRDLAESMGVSEGSDVRLTLVGRQMVVEPEDDNIPIEGFRRAFAAVLRKTGKTFELLAAHDAGHIDLLSEEERHAARRVRGRGAR
jgi:antitoxin component of MazEF toxin-antitoxin module